MDYQTITLTIEDGVAVLRLNRPEVMNALNAQMRAEILHAVRDAPKSARVLVVTGEGRAFCSGQDLGAAGSAAEIDLERTLRDEYEPMLKAIFDCPIPTIAAVNGAAAGAGMNIALACDIRLGSTAARFGQTFSRRGLHPDWGGTYFLPRLVGMAKACELIWSGRMVDAEEALSLGIVSELTEPDELLRRAHEMARSFAEGPPVAIRLAKRAMYRGMESSLREALEFETYAQNICRETDDAREGIRAFVEKRAPQFSGS